MQPGRVLGHYRIERLIGRGGMGEVYRARDLKLDRDVALKVLPAEVASDPARLERFEREAKSVAGLSHAHIVHLYSVEEDAGVRFLTMELVEGSGLDTVIHPGGLPLAKVFDIGMAIADALSAAHEKGVVHRDLKPANVMVSHDGRAMVLDFGLAKLAEAPASAESVTQAASITSAGTLIGTVPYMSPEQLRGQAVDHRSDIFSLGVMLYEMATGRRPFGGNTPAETLSSILRDPPRPVSEARHDAPRHLERIIDHCLQKEPRDRFQTARDVFNELRGLRREVESGVSFASEIAPAVPRGLGKRAWIGIAAAALIVVVGLVALKSRGTAKPAADAAGAASAMSDAKSIAVLPFVNMSSDKEQEYFSDGISEELLNLLARVPGLRVAARTSSFSFKGKAVEIPEIARQLRVAHVLEGSVRKAGTQVRITAQLIHAADGYHLWSQTYDRKLDDVFAIQDEIAADVVGQLKVALLGEAPKARETNGEAYALYLQARQLGRLATPDGFAKADALLHRAIQIDPRYAPAWSALTAIELNRMGSGMVPVAEGLPKAREAVTKAIEIDPQFAPGHAQLGWIAVYFEDDLPSAARHFERALALDPKDQNVRGNATIMLQALGRSDEAARLLGQLAELDPLNLTAQNNAGYVYLYAGRVDDAIASFRTALTLAPDMGAARTGLGLALLRKGDAQAAIEEIQKEPVEFWRLYGLPMVYHVLGRKADSDAALAQFIAKYEKEAASNVAAVYAFRGEADKAFEWLDKAVGYKDPGLAEVPLTGYFVDLYADPRWTSFLRKTNRAPDQLAKIQFKMPPMP